MLQARRSDVDAMSKASEQLSGVGEEILRSLKDKVKAIKEQWESLLTLVDSRQRLGLSFVTFHKKAQQVWNVPT